MEKYIGKPEQTELMREAREFNALISEKLNITNSQCLHAKKKKTKTKKPNEIDHVIKVFGDEDLVMDSIMDFAKDNDIPIDRIK